MDVTGAKKTVEENKIEETNHSQLYFFFFFVPFTTTFANLQVFLFEYIQI